jgi:hypothetical protein
MTTPRLDGQCDLIDLAGRRITPNLSDDFYYRNPWGSNFPDGLDFIGPGFDVEVVHYDIVEEKLQVAVVDGTSAACPFIAAGTFLVYSMFLDTYGLTSDHLHKIDLALKLATEGFTTDGVNVKCNTPDDDFNSETTLNWDYSRDTELGYGIIDFYDAILIAANIDNLDVFDMVSELICPSVATSNFEVELITPYDLNTIITTFSLESSDRQYTVDTSTYSNPASTTHTFDITSIPSGDFFWVTVTVCDINGDFLFTLSQEVYIAISASDPPSPPSKPGLW